MAHDRDYEVGYGRPPKHGQIKKGERRNPAGRRGKSGGKTEFGASSLPKTAKDLWADATIEEMNRLVPMRIGAKTVEVPAIQAFLRKQLQEALTESTSAASRRILFEQLGKALDHQVARDKDWADFIKSNKAELEELLRANQRERQEAQRRGDRNDILILDPIPHPWNMVANDWTGEYRIEGPLNQAEFGLELRMLVQRDDAEGVMRRSFEAFKLATSDEERTLHRDALEHARSVWKHYNDRVSLRKRLPTNKLDWLDADKEPDEPWDNEF